MAEYNPRRDARWNYGGDKWKLSRSKIDLFVECPRCFYIDNKLGIRRPSIPAFLLNQAVDDQLKREFDRHRAEESRHPFQEEYGVDARPAQHEMIDEWRNNFEGVQCFHEPTGMVVSGAIDDLWINNSGEYLAVDYKATAKTEPVTRLEGRWHEGYKRQIEVYQWLLRRNGLDVSDLAYFVYCTGRKDDDVFHKKIEFDVALIPHEGDDSWVEPTLQVIKASLEGDRLPESGPECEYCGWWEARLGIS